jgi:hypothetical protein
MLFADDTGKPDDSCDEEGGGAGLIYGIANRRR